MSTLFFSKAKYMSTIIHLIILVHQSLASSEPVDPTQGFVSLPLNRSYYHIQKPYDLPEDRHKPHSQTSQTKPRTEIAIQGVWQFEGYGYVPAGTSGVCIMQVFGASPHATTLMLRVYNGSLMYYRSQVLVDEIYDRWFRLNVIHDVDGSKVKVYIDGYPKLEVDGRGGTSHAFKCGVYAQDDDSFYMESRWKGLRVLKKSD
ncbi:hypothetical protein BT93_I0204 [Corymbia citriodora subsp. variegata]|nr:hypothetical protein BT93_I0204 [Corymbia citriodora subsp. variegata]